MSPRRSAPHVPLSSALLIVLAVGFFSATESIIKTLTLRYPIPLLLWARFAVQALILAALFAPALGRGIVRSRQMGLQLWRGVMLIGSSATFYFALRGLPLADATAVIYTTPVFVVILSVVLLKERMTAARIGLVVAGFCGMLLIARPGASIVHGAALLALVSAGFYAVFQILTRKVHDDDARVTVAIPAFCGVVLALPLLFFSELPKAVPWTDAVLLVTMGVLGTAGHFLFIRAFRGAPASALTPFTYVQLVWAVFFGWLVFGQLPDGYTVAGIALIAGSGLLLAWHERRSRIASSSVLDPIVVD